MTTKVKDDLKTIIESLLDCESKGRKCKKCKDKDECLIFIRGSIAVALQFILNELDKDKIPESIYS